MTWSGFRPSDDPNTYGYSIPSNMYAAGALQRALALNAAVWRCRKFHATASKLLADIEAGAQR
jgi:meiotically up-regulated gene 157 (Mug157) protein